ncbi:MAG: DNA polymerase III subunit epsilon [Thioalkalivibrionaceae bacterium]
MNGNGQSVDANVAGSQRHRQVVLDTETTGLSPADGHRVIEIGALEIVDRRLTGARFHCYLCPDREVDAGAIEVHGLTNEFLAKQPRFRDVQDELLSFLDGAELVIHNAPFDLAFLNAELERAGAPVRDLQSRCAVLDTLPLARKLNPGARASLDALCKRYGVNASARKFHGALLDAELLADVYLAMTGGQVGLSLEAQQSQDGGARQHSRRGALRVIAPTADELAAHDELLALLDKASGAAIWRRVTTQDPA